MVSKRAANLTALKYIHHRMEEVRWGIIGVGDVCEVKVVQHFKNAKEVALAR